MLTHSYTTRRTVPARPSTTPPRLHAHFQAESFTPLLYTVEWFTTCFTISCERTLALCAYDLLLAGVDDLLLRLGVALLAEAQVKIDVGGEGGWVYCYLVASQS